LINAVCKDAFFTGEMIKDIGWKIGDKKDGCRIIGIEHDTLSDDSAERDYALLTLMQENEPRATSLMGSYIGDYKSSTYYGWSNDEDYNDYTAEVTGVGLRNDLINEYTLYRILPDPDKLVSQFNDNSYFREVIKQTAAKGSVSTQVRSNDHFFLLSVYEVTGKDGEHSHKEGKQYEYF
jgi:hypothetical protein